MSGAAATLYEPLIERELERIPAAVSQFRESHSADELFVVIARFALLAYAPSSHSRHALLACLSAWDLREKAGDRFEALVIECARYAAESRRPWSEPPILDPPPVDDSRTADVDALRAAITGRDTRAAEAWLARRYADDAAVRELFAVACEKPGELGHNLIVANAVVRLSEILGEKGRYAVLRVAVWELLAATEETMGESSWRPGDDELLEALVARAVHEKGSIDSLHGVFLFDAAQSAGVLDRMRGRLAALCGGPANLGPSAAAAPDVPVYRLARDYGACLKAHAIAARVGDPRLDPLVAAAHENLEHGESFDEWTLA